MSRTTRSEYSRADDAKTLYRPRKTTGPAAAAKAEHTKVRRETRVMAAPIPNEEKDSLVWCTLPA